MSAEEIPLPVGRMTNGVVRVGDTVRRPTKLSSPFVARVLAHLEATGCAWAPRYLGEDEQRRDIFSYIPDVTPAKWACFSDAALRCAARIIRELHDRTRGSELCSGAVICHNDPGPNNFVFVDDLPVGIIDFDTACPGQPLEDLGYLAWSWCISSKPERGPVTTQAHQVRVLADAYGVPQAERDNLLHSVIERQQRNAHFWSERLADPSSTPTSPAKMSELIAWSQQEAQFTEAHRNAFRRALFE